MAKILLAEDNLSNVVLFETLLKHQGHSVDVATDGQKAAEMGLDPLYALILMDIGLPQLSGLEATRKIRAAGLKTPVIALTAENDRATESACQEVGMSGFLNKPITPKDFIQKIATLIL